MANAVIARIVDDTIVIWTDGTLSDEAFSRRNIIAVGNNYVVVHDDVKTWLRRVKRILSLCSLSSISTDKLAKALVPRLRRVVGTTPTRLGVVVIGFESQTVPIILGLHSSRNFAVRRFIPSIIGGLPASVWNYLQFTFKGIEQDVDFAVDIILTCVGAYYNMGLPNIGSPKASAIAVISNGQAIKWLTPDEISDRISRNNQKVNNLHKNLTENLLRAGF